MSPLLEEKDLKKISCYEKECVGNNVKPNSWIESPGLILIQFLGKKRKLKNLKKNQELCEYFPKINLYINCVGKKEYERVILLRTLCKFSLFRPKIVS